jgi:hypothetical protein
MSEKTVIVVDVICLMLFVLMGIYIFALPTAMQDQLMPLFIVINPFRTGAWIMGIGFLVTCLWGKAKIGLIWGLIMIACYLITAFISLVGLMTVATAYDLLWYLHPVPIVTGCAVLFYRSVKKRR